MLERIILSNPCSKEEEKEESYKSESAGSPCRNDWVRSFHL